MKIQALYRYPLKSAAAQAVEQIQCTQHGFFGDRTWVLTDPEGRFVTARECPALSQIHVQGSRFFFIDSLSPPAAVEEPGQVSVWKRQHSALRGDENINAWFTQMLQRPLVLWHLTSDASQHFGDSNPVMVLFQATADAMTQALESPFEPLQFRPNILLSGGSPFAEGDLGVIRIGDVELTPVEPCTRCKMINLPPESDHYPQPMRVSAALRALSPDFVAGHHYSVRRAETLNLGDSPQ
ncbi:MAG: MOSC domain-containing protein [Litorivicinus sp.]